ncbi:hypothetical protein [Actinomycetospora soli]|uniref:hypothetical protein n=1 Tax=Actinomycetospora soli TaxID=2893887 RepID=UPI001E3A326B|nr:hypothetical protein [Actinomycetospora soli]MCD2191360.1 hypothetical protein [Actinomycetospora soli]
MTRKAVLVVVTLTVILFSGACTRYVYVPVPASPPGASGVAASPSTVEAASTPAVAGFGSTQSLGQGLSVTAGQPKPFKASSSAAGQEGAERLVLVPITFTNDSGRYVNFSDTYYTNMTVDGVTAQSVQDMGNKAGGVENVGGMFNKPTPTGKSITIGLVWPLQNAPAEIGLKITSNDYSGSLPTPEWSGRV